MTELLQTKSDRSWLENVTLVFSRISEVKLEAAINDDESVNLAPTPSWVEIQLKFGI